jgi:hypothetical protein
MVSFNPIAARLERAAGGVTHALLGAWAVVGCACIEH